MCQLTIKPRAIEMAKDAYEWYEEQQVGLGDLFLKELDRCYDKIKCGRHHTPKSKTTFVKLS